MKYPVHILPQKYYKKISNSLYDNFLIRHFILNEENSEICDCNGQIENKFLFHPTEKFGDLSTSVLGVFTIDDIKVNLTSEGKDKYGSYCEGDFNCDVPQYPKDFVFDDNNGLRKFWTIKIGNIHNQTCSFEKVNAVTPSSFTCHVIHTPAKWNFWHFSIRWFLNDDRVYYFEKFNEITAGNKKRIATSVRALLKENIEIGINQKSNVPEGYYLLEENKSNNFADCILDSVVSLLKKIKTLFLIVKLKK